MWFAKILAFRSGARFHGGGFFGRQAGGDVFGTFDLARVAFFKNAFVAALFAHHLGARLRSLPIRLLRVVAETAFGAEAHAAVAA